MPELIVIAFSDEARALAAYEEVQLLEDRLVIKVGGVAFVHIDDTGKLRVETPRSTARLGARAASSAVFGTVLGALFFMPLIGLAAGGAVGALFAGLNRTGIDDEFRKRVRNAVPDGHSAVVVYALQVREQAFVDALEAFGGEIHRATLSKSDEEELLREMTDLD